MAIAHSRRTSCAAVRCPSRITITVIHSAANITRLSADTATSQAGTA